jgi:hypothetical protein
VVESSNAGEGDDVTGVTRLDVSMIGRIATKGHVAGGPRRDTPLSDAEAVDGAIEFDDGDAIADPNQVLERFTEADGRRNPYCRHGMGICRDTDVKNAAALEREHDEGGGGSRT